MAEELRRGPGENLFRFLAECILVKLTMKFKIRINKATRKKNIFRCSFQDFQTVHKLPPCQQYNLGFCFSLPMIQKSLDVGILVSWTKNYNCPGVEGEDVVGMLNKALAEVGVGNVKVVAILNDTTGTLVAGSHDYPDAGIGLILGTGTNGSFMEKAERVVR